MPDGARDQDRPPKTSSAKGTDSSSPRQDASAPAHQIGIVIAGAGQSAPYIRAAVAHYLQRAAGNAAFSSLVTPRQRPSQMHVQRQPTTRTREELDAAYQAAVSAGQWQAAAENLNGFNDADIATRLGGLNHDQLIWLYTAALNGMSGVSQNRILSPIAARDLDAAYQACVRTAHWDRAAILLNGFNDADIATKVALLSAANKAAMLAVCPAWATRVRVALIGTPVERYLVPFDHAPQSAPGERIIFRAEYDHPTRALFRLVFSGTGGTFDAVGGPTSKTIGGLESDNVYFLIASGMTAATPTTVRLEVQLTDGTVVKSENWTFGVKATTPTTMTQLETEADRPLGSVYTYQLGPDIGTPGQPDYEHQTILERFEARTCNITVADLKPAYASAHGLTSAAAITAHFFGTSSRNGTFTIDNQDRVYDRHGGMPDKAVFEAALVTMKEITCDLPQIYEVQPGVPLARFIVRRVLRVDGTKWLRKRRVP
jgi:hypothetical protein